MSLPNPLPLDDAGSVAAAPRRRSARGGFGGTARQKHGPKRGTMTTDADAPIVAERPRRDRPGVYTLAADPGVCVCQPTAHTGAPCTGPLTADRLCERHAAIVAAICAASAEARARVEAGASAGAARLVRAIRGRRGAPSERQQPVPVLRRCEACAARYRVGEGHACGRGVAA